jgi:proton-coupled amino acid transporter
MYLSHVSFFFSFKVVYAFEGIGLALPMRRAMIKPELYHQVMDMGYVVVTLMYLFFGSVGYLGYGDATSGEITSNIGTGTVPTLVKVS